MPRSTRSTAPYGRAAAWLLGASLAIVAGAVARRMLGRRQADPEPDARTAALARWRESGGNVVAVEWSYEPARR